MGRDLAIGILIGAFLLWLFTRNAQPQIQQVKNAETWEWIDWQGNTRSATVHRDVKAQ